MLCKSAMRIGLYKRSVNNNNSGICHVWLVRWVASYNQEVLSLLVITNGVSHMIGISSNRHVSCALGTRKLLAYS